MKKRIFGFILLLAFSGTIFYMGWVQLSLNEESYGIVFTKTSGWNKNIIKPGEFVWMWEKIIPKNLSLHSFPIKMNKSSIKVNGELPSAKIYSAYLGENAKFNYDLNIDIFFAINPELLPSIVANESLRPEDLTTWYEEYEDKIKVRLLDFLFINTDIQDQTEKNYFKYAGFEEDLESYLNENLKEVKISKIAIKTLIIPDFDLYKDTKKQYYNIFNKRQDILNKSLNASADNQVKENIRIEKLKRYGQLFTEYPILIKYLALGIKDSDMDKIIGLLDKNN